MRILWYPNSCPSDSSCQNFVRSAQRCQGAYSFICRGQGAFKFHILSPKYGAYTLSHQLAANTQMEMPFWLLSSLANYQSADQRPLFLDLLYSPVPLAFGPQMTQKIKADPSSVDFSKVSAYYYDLALKFFELPNRNLDHVLKEDFLRSLHKAYKTRFWSIVDASHKLLPQRHIGSLHSKLTLEEKVMFQKGHNAVRLHREWQCNCRKRKVVLSADGFVQNKRRAHNP